MGWETRKRGGRYYTRSKKINGRVVREYVGSGSPGELASEIDAVDRLEREARRGELLAEKASVAKIEETLDSFCRNTDALVAEALEASGYHRHKGEWRKKRGQRYG